MAESAFGPISPELVLVSPDLREALMREFAGTDRDRGRRFDVPAVFARPPAAEEPAPGRSGPLVQPRPPEPERLADRHAPAEPSRPLEESAVARPNPPRLPEQVPSQTPPPEPVQALPPDPPPARQLEPVRPREPVATVTQAPELLPVHEPRSPLEPVPQPSLVVGSLAYFVQRVLVLAGQAAVVVAAVVVAIIVLELLSHL